MLKKLQILETSAHPDQFFQLIKFLASQFIPDHFKRIHIKIDISIYTDKFDFESKILQEYDETFPKKIQIINLITYDIFEMIIQSIYESIVKFEYVKIDLDLPGNFKKLLQLSNRVKEVRIETSSNHIYEDFKDIETND